MPTFLVMISQFAFNANLGTMEMQSVLPGNSRAEGMPFQGQAPQQDRVLRKASGPAEGLAHQQGESSHQMA